MVAQILAIDFFFFINFIQIIIKVRLETASRFQPNSEQNVTYIFNFTLKCFFFFIFQLIELFTYSGQICLFETLV